MSELASESASTAPGTSTRRRLPHSVSTRRLTGMSPIATVMLAVLVFGCVLTVTAVPRAVLHGQTAALRQALSGVAPAGQTISAQSTWDDLVSQFGPVEPGTAGDIALTPGDTSDIAGQLRRDFDTGVVRLAASAEDWASMTSILHPVVGATTSGGLAVKTEVSWRQPLASHVRLVAGSLSPAGGSSATGSTGGSTGAGGSAYYPVLSVVVTEATARQFRLRAGSVMTVSGPVLARTGEPVPVRLVVSGIVTPRDPGSAFWTGDPAVTAPELIYPSPQSSPYWLAGILATPGEAVAVQRDFGTAGLNLQWTFPMDFSSLTGNHAGQLRAALQRLSTQEPRVTGAMAPASATLTVAPGPLATLNGWTGSAAAADVLLWLLYVSLGVTGVVVLLLAARMLMLRRSAELAVRRARGASLLQIARTVTAGTVAAAVPGAVLGAAAAAGIEPGQAPSGGWLPALVTLALAVGAPAVLAAWQHRLSGQRVRRGRELAHVRRGRRGSAGVRLVIEVTIVAAAIAGVMILRQQGALPGAGVDLYTSAAPVLVAMPVLIVVLRVYPLVLRGLLRGAARGTSATSFIGLARAASTALGTALPVFALVLAVTTAGFAGMVRDAVTRGEANASWQAAGADALVSTTATSVTITPAAQRAIAAVPGVTRSAVAMESQWTAPNGTPVTLIAVDPAAYSALVATTQTWPAVNHGLLTGDGALASPTAAADLRGPNLGNTGSGSTGSGSTGSGSTGLATLTAADGAPLSVRVTGTLSGTPALPAGGDFVVVPMSAVRGVPGLSVNVMLLSGSAIDVPALYRAVDAHAQSASVTARSAVLTGLADAPLQRSTFAMLTLAAIAAALLGLVAMLAQLALGAADRELTLTRLATMGLDTGQRTRLVLLETLPAILATTVAAAVSVLVLPSAVGPAIDLSVFTQSDVSVPFVPDSASFALPLLGLAAVAAIALTIEIQAGRRRGVAASMRAPSAGYEALAGRGGSR